jgi:antitoxin component YwqK of YwqJK toxin-antitoxin module
MIKKIKPLSLGYEVYESENDFDIFSLDNFTGTLKTFDDKDHILFKKYFVNGELHNEFGPAMISYFRRGKVLRKEYYQNGKMFRENKLPNREVFDKRGELNISSWHNSNGFLHNLYGPSKIKRSYNVEWHKDGRMYNYFVNKWLAQKGIDWKEMDDTDFLIMWTEIELELQQIGVKIK